MRIDLNNLRKAGWHVDMDVSAGTVEVMPPPMQPEEHTQLTQFVKQYVTQPMSVDMVLGQLYGALGRAALMEAVED